MRIARDSAHDGEVSGGAVECEEDCAGGKRGGAEQNSSNTNLKTKGTLQDGKQFPGVERSPAKDTSKSAKRDIEITGHHKKKQFLTNLTCGYIPDPS